MKGSWSLPLRTWLAIAMVAVIVTPVIAWLGTIVAFRGPMKTTPDPWQRKALAAQTAADRLIRERRADWADPAFQGELAALLDPARLSVALLDAGGSPIYSHGVSMVGEPLLPPGAPGRAHGTLQAPAAVSVNGSSQGLSLGMTRDAGGNVTGIYLLGQTGGSPMVMWMLLAAIAGLTLAGALVVRWVGRSVSAPILALSVRAGLVNRGQLEFDLPASHVRELNELGGAFGAMRDGLRSSIMEQAAMEQDRRLFIAAVAHDLRTPLSSVRGYLEGIRDGVARTPAMLERYVAVALDKTGHLERLIADLFAYARTEYLSQPPVWEPLDLGELLTAAVDGLRPQAGAKGVTLALDGDPAPVTVQGDRPMLNRVVDNLLDNAIRYTPSGGTVTVGWRETAAEARFWVQDTGPGIAPADLGHVFEPLYRGDKARRSGSGGAGLGLAIARRLVEAHGGSIAAANQEAGSRFSVTLPHGS